MLIKTNLYRGVMTKNKIRQKKHGQLKVLCVKCRGVVSKQPLHSLKQKIESKEIQLSNVCGSCS